MTTFDDVRKLKGKDVLIVSPESSIYVAFLSNVHRPSRGGNENTVAMVEMRHYILFSNSSNLPDAERSCRINYVEERIPVHRNDNIGEFSSYNAMDLLKALKKCGYVETLYKNEQ